MSISRRRDNGSCRGYAACAGLVFNVKSPTNFGPQFLGDNTRGDIGDPARGEWHDDANGFGRVFGFSVAWALSER